MSETPKPSYSSNSHVSKEKQPVEAVVKNAKLRKTPVTRKIASTFISEDAPNVGSYILFDVVIPALKSMLSDMVSEGTERILFGSSSRRTSRRRGTTSTRSASYISYNQASRDDRQLSARARATHDFGEIVLESRGEAETVLERLSDMIEDYGMATVSDLYDLCEITGSYTDDKWGWSDSRSFAVARTRDGYILDLPKPRPIN